MRILHNVGAVGCSLLMMACVQTTPAATQRLDTPSFASQNARPATVRSASSTARWTCTATGAGMAGTCTNN